MDIQPEQVQQTAHVIQAAPQIAEAAKPAILEPLTYLWVAVLAGWGGIANFCHKLKTGHARPFNIAEFVGELVISSFAGIITYYFCQATHIDGYLSAVLVGISGHMGSRAIFLIERKLFEKWGIGDPNTLTKEPLDV